jgi:competence ComEA-like helix-hairpin-helix protein
MRSLAVLSLLFVLALASCGGRERVANSNSTEPLARPATELSGRQCVNLNTASAEELERLPGIGEMTARKIIEYRVQNGPFRRPEEIIIIEGFSERKYRAIADLVCVN